MHPAVMLPTKRSKMHIRITLGIALQNYKWVLIRGSSILDAYLFVFYLLFTLLSVFVLFWFLSIVPLLDLR
jgi:hypothetical protein